MLKKLRNLFFEERAHWNIGIVDSPIESFLEIEKPKVKWLEGASSRGFRADPFGILHKGKLCILFENYEYEKKKGEIWAKVGERSEKVMELPVHASYPFLIQEDNEFSSKTPSEERTSCVGEIYCVPETNAANEVAIYKAKDFPWKWEKIAVLFEAAASDATFFKHNGLWFCFYTLADAPHSKLYLRYAKNLFGEWKEHPKNPVKEDIGSSRPAGTIFTHEEKIYRPAQDCSKTYGGSVTICEIKKLNEREFEEEEVKRIEPYSDRDYKYGLHTLSSVNGMTLIDGKAYNYRLRGLKEILKIILKKIWR